MPARIGYNETRRPYGDKYSGKAEEACSEDGRRQSERASAAPQAVGRTERGGRRRPTPARRGGKQGVGIHQSQQPAEPENRREILADDKLRKVFGKDKVTMFEMNKQLAQHLK
jgi:hypothetical protein